jgi:RAD54-like protein 2
MDLSVSFKGIQNALSKPGPDLVICDEGHRIKNNQTNISQALKRMKTRQVKCSQEMILFYTRYSTLSHYSLNVSFLRSCVYRKT